MYKYFCNSDGGRLSFGQTRGASRKGSRSNRNCSPKRFRLRTGFPWRRGRSVNPWLFEKEILIIFTTVLLIDSKFYFYFYWFRWLWKTPKSSRWRDLSCLWARSNVCFEHNFRCFLLFFPTFFRFFFWELTFWMAIGRERTRTVKPESIAHALSFNSQISGNTHLGFWQTQFFFTPCPHWLRAIQDASY